MAGAELTVDLNARLANFEKGMDQANRSLDKLENNSKKTDAALAKMSRTAKGLAGFLGVSLGAAGITGAASATLRWADSLDNAASRLGVTSELLQALRANAEDFGSSLEATDIAIQRFGRRLGEVRAGGAKNLAEILKENNIALLDSAGNYRNVSAVLGDYSKLLSGSADEAERNALAMAAFDSEGVRFGQSLASINGELDTFVDEMRELGFVVSEEAVQALDRGEQRLANFGKTLRGLFRNAIGTTASELGRLWDRVAYGVDPLADMNAHVQAFEEHLKGVKAAAQGIPDIRDKLFAGGVEPLLTEQQLDSALNRIDSLYEGAINRAEAFRERVLAIGEPVPGLRTFGELDLVDVYDGFSQLQSLISSGDTAEAQRQMEHLAQAMEELNESADAGTALAIADLKKQLADLSSEVFAPQKSRDEIKDSLISQLLEAQEYAKANPLKWDVQLDVSGAIDNEATALGLKP